VSYPRKTSIALWVLQAFLALFFVLGSGAPKLVFTLFLSSSDLPMPIPLPVWLVIFIGLCEISGGLALIVPGITGRRTGLTPLAGVCLLALTVCATIYQLMAGEPGNAVFAIVMGLLCLVVAYGRSRVAPHGAATPAASRAAAA
jgi:uncharacterized membrane protein